MAPCTYIFYLFIFCHTAEVLENLLISFFFFREDATAGPHYQFFINSVVVAYIFCVVIRRFLPRLILLR